MLHSQLGSHHHCDSRTFPSLQKEAPDPLAATPQPVPSPRPPHICFLSLALLLWSAALTRPRPDHSGPAPVPRACPVSAQGLPGWHTQICQADALSLQFTLLLPSSETSFHLACDSCRSPLLGLPSLPFARASVGSFLGNSRHSLGGHDSCWLPHCA